MTEITQGFFDTPVAELERHGLDHRLVNMLEDKLGVVYVRDLEGVERVDLLAVRGFDVRCVDRVGVALAGLLDSVQGEPEAARAAEGGDDESSGV